MSSDIQVYLVCGKKNINKEEPVINRKSLENFEFKSEIENKIKNLQKGIDNLFLMW